MTKLIVASRKILSRMLGIPGYLFRPRFLVVIKMAKNARVSTMPKCGSMGGEAHQNSRVEIMLRVGE